MGKSEIDYLLEICENLLDRRPLTEAQRDRLWEIRGALVRCKYGHPMSDHQRELIVRFAELVSVDSERERMREEMRREIEAAIRKIVDELVDGWFGRR
ncbi:MAG: hypothetical protein ACUVXI_13290 [bacterium]